MQASLPGSVAQEADGRPADGEMTRGVTIISAPEEVGEFQQARDGDVMEIVSQPGNEKAVTWRSQGSLEDSTHIGVTIMQLQEYLAIQRSMRQNLRSLPLTFLLWITYMVVVFYHCQAQVNFQSSDFVRSSLAARFYTPDGTTSRRVRLEDLTNWREVMPWIDHALVPGLQSPGEMQVLVGFVRVLQIRGANVTKCARLDESMQAIYGSGCSPAEGAVSRFGPIRQKFELTESAFEPLDSSGRAYEFWLEVNRSRTVVSERIQKLSREGWLDRNTQEVSVDGLFLNIEAHIYTRFTIAFTMHREGWMESELIVKPLRGEVYSHWSQVFLDGIWFLLFVSLAYETVMTAIRNSDVRIIYLHLVDPYTWIDFSLVACGSTVVVVFYFYVYNLSKFVTEVYKVGEMPPLSMAEAPAEMKVQAALDAREYTKQLLVIFDWFSWFNWMIGGYRFCGFCYTMLMIGRFFRGFLGQPRMTVMVQTLLHSVNFIFHFFLFLAVVFCTFALSGYILFGEQIDGWSTPGRSFARLLLVLFMRFDYNEFHKVAPISSAVWFSSFFVVASVLLVKLLTAAILHHYLDVRERLGEPGIPISQQFREWIRDLQFGHTYTGSQRSLPFDDLLTALSADTDPSFLKNLGRLQADRRLRSRADLHKAERGELATHAYLVKKGLDPAMADRLLLKCCEWTHNISVTSSPLHRMLILLARQLTWLRQEADKVSAKVHRKFDRNSKVMDRVDLKHAKSLAIARRIKKAQELPPGWSAHADDEGRRYFVQEETGLTSWTLPRHLM